MKSVDADSAEGTAKASWLHYVCAEVRAARRSAIPVDGICLYPILDYPGWDNDRPCAVGLFSMADEDGRRRTDRDFETEIEAQQTSFGAGRQAPQPFETTEAL